MEPRIDEVVWRGPWILVKLLDVTSRRLFNNCWVKIYFQDNCLAEGTGQSLIDKCPKEDDPDDLRILLDICDLQKGRLQQPTSLHVICGNQTQKIEIARRTRHEAKNYPTCISGGKNLHP